MKPLVSSKGGVFEKGTIVPVQSIPIPAMTVVNYSSKMEGDNNNVPDVWSEKPWCCAHCDIKFTNVGHLIEHSRIHLNVPTND